MIQKAFDDELHLIIDRPKQGMGNSNDGNIARHFFENSETSARILGIDHDLMRRFHVILQVISSRFNVKINSFEKYCKRLLKSSLRCTLGIQCRRLFTKS